MRRLIFITFLFAGIAYAGWTVDSNSATWTRYTITKLSDGGVSYTLCGFANKPDGGRAITACVTDEVTNATTRTQLINMGNTGLQKWKAEHAD